MLSSSLYIALLAVLCAGPTFAKVIRVEVGEGRLAFTPDNIQAAIGDIIEFHFNAESSVIASNVDRPCTPVASGGFYSGIMPAGNNKYFTIPIEKTNPIFFYSGVGSQCQEGMVGVINQGLNTLVAFRSAAASLTNKSINPNAPFGGTLSSKAISSEVLVLSTPAITESQSASVECPATSAEVACPVTEQTSVPFGTPNTTVTGATAATSNIGLPSNWPTDIISSSHNGYLISPIASVACLALAFASIFAF